MVVQREMEFLVGVSFAFFYSKRRGGRKVENCILIQRSPREREKERKRKSEKAQITRTARDFALLNNCPLRELFTNSYSAEWDELKARYQKSLGFLSPALLSGQPDGDGINHHGPTLYDSVVAS